MIKVKVDKSELKKLSDLPKNYIEELSSIAITSCVVFDCEAQEIYFKRFKQDILEKYNINYTLEIL